MQEQLFTFQSFNDIALAKQMAERLEAHNIPFVIENGKPLVDGAFVDTSVLGNIYIKLKAVDFEKAELALEEYYGGQLDTAEEDYYLYNFTDSELHEIISKPDEWGRWDYQLAQKILKDRGHEIDEVGIKKIKQERLKQLAMPEKASKFLLFFGYCFIPFGAIPAFLIGRHLFYSRRNLPNGQVIFSYVDSDRKHGDRIMIISGLFIITGVICLVIFVLLYS